MSFVRAAAALGALSTVAVTLAAGPAQAAAGRIDHVQSTRGTVRVLYSTPGATRPDPGTVKVTLDGTPLEATAAPASGTNQIRRTTVLAIDVSNSMKSNGKFTAAKQAADLYLASVPADVYVGVVTYAGSVTVAQRPTLDRAVLRRTVDGLTLSSGTFLYAGLSKAVDLTGGTGQRDVLVLSDGRDTSSSRLADVTAKLRASKARVDVVALAPQARDIALLKPLSAAGKGSVISAGDPGQLGRIFSKQAEILANQLLITVRPRATVKATEGTLAVSVSAAGATYTDSAFVTMKPAATPRQAAPRATALAPVTTRQLPPRLMQAGLVAIGLAVVVIVLGLGGGLGKKEPSLESRIAAYTGKGATGPRAPLPSPQGVTAQAVGMATKALASNQGLEVRLAARLEAAGMSLKPAEWLLLHAGIAVGGTAFVFMLTGQNLLLTGLALLGGVVVPWLYLGIKKNRRLKAFNGQLAGTLQLMAGSLQAGLSLAQGMDTIVREGADPVAGEFRRALVETRLGVQVEDALDSMADRMMSADFRWTVMAIRIQREVGGNLAELMLNVAATLREREYLRRQVKSLSAEGRFSAYILLGLPPGVLLYESLVNGSYLAPLITTAIGWVMLAVMGLLMGLGAFMMMRMIKLEV